MSQGHLELFRRVTVVKRCLGHRNWYWSRSVLSSLSMGVCINLPSWKCRGRLQLICSFLQQFATIRGSFFWAFVTRVAVFLACRSPVNQSCVNVAFHTQKGKSTTVWMLSLGPWLGSRLLWKKWLLKEAWHTGESAPVRVKRCRMDRKSVRAWAVSWGFASLKPKHFHAEAFCSFWPSMHFAVTVRCCAALWSATFRRCEGIFFGPTAVWHSVVITARSWIANGSLPQLHSCDAAIWEVGLCDTLNLFYDWKIGKKVATSPWNPVSQILDDGLAPEPSYV